MPVYSFNTFLKEKFGCRVHKISLDGGFSCPNIDGTLSLQGCFFCNNRGFVQFLGKNKSLEEQVSQSIVKLKQRFKAEKFIAYFQSFSSTYAKTDELRSKYDIIKKFPEIVGLAVSTRPDNITISEEKLDLLAEYQKKYMVWVEFGLQSSNNNTLKMVNRNHTAEDFARWAKKARQKGLLVGAHIILGLPSEKKEDMFNTAKFLADLGVDGVKFHAFHILKNTVFEKIHNKKPFPLLEEDEYVDIICGCIRVLPEKTVILRLVSDADPQYLVGPLWVNEKHRVIDKIRRNLGQSLL